MATEVELLAGEAARHHELAGVATSLAAFCQRTEQGLAGATFEQQRQLVILLIDRVVVTDGAVEIRYVLPTSPASEHIRFCQLRKDYFHHPAMPPELLARLNAPTSDARRDATFATGGSTAVEVVPLVAVELLRASTRTAPQSLDGLNGVQQRL